MHQWQMPTDIPHPEDCPLMEEVYEELARRKGISADAKEQVLQLAQDRRQSPIALKSARKHKGQKYDERDPTMYWMKARAVSDLPPSFHKCILAYMSDLNFIGVAGKTMHLSHVAKPPNKLSMISSLDHAMWFYDNNFSCSEWILQVIEAAAGGEGRGFVHARLYTQAGRLIAVAAQEGVVRADLGLYEGMRSKL